MNSHHLRLFIASALGALALGFSTTALRAQNAFQQNNLVSDVPGLAAHLDPNLVNPWGIATSASSPFWVSDNGSGRSTLYNTPGVPQSLVVTIPGTGGQPGAPTGVIFNGTSSFNGDLFIFGTENGTIAGWRLGLGTVAETLIDNSGAGASYKGLAFGTLGANNNIYAANFGQGRIDAYSTPATLATLTGTFADPTLPVGYAPFNIQNIGGNLFVTYAVKGAGGDDVPGAGHGIVDEFDLNGNLLMRFAAAGVLDSPWGMALAPASFGSFGGDLLIGNFGDGTINAFNFATGSYVGTLNNQLGNPLVIDGLWGLRFGNGGNGGAANTLYFAAGIDGEDHGLFGAITPVPEPSTYGFAASLLLAGVGVLRKLRRHRGQVNSG